MRLVVVDSILFVTVVTFLSSLSLLIGNVQAVNTVGRPCTNDTDCTGLNEYCAINDQVDPPCMTGFCACQHCFMLDANLAQCEATVYKTLNDPCDDFEVGHAVLPKHSQCRGGIVLCRNHHAFIDGQCVRIESNGDYGQPCGASDPCDGELICGVRFSICTCPDVNKKWDAATATCVPREFGDYCVSDEECDSTMGDMNAVSELGALVCRAGVCTCAPGLQESQASFIGKNGLLALKTVCQSPSSSNGLAKLQKCSVRVGGFTGAPLNTCDTALTCYQCPEDIRRQDFTTNDGYCKALAPPPFKDLCPGQTPEPGFKRPVPKAGTFGNPCTSNSECSGANELCVRTVNVDPPCQRGTCGCLPGFVANPELGYLCVIVIKRKVGDPCNVEAETPGVTYPEAAFCNNGTIRCRPRHTVGASGDCDRTVFDGWIDAPCNADGDCEGELVCFGGRCSCSSAYKWVAVGRGRCAPKDIGDACATNTDCSSASAGGEIAQCINAMCSCPAMTTLVTVSEFDPDADNYLTTKTVCVSDLLTNQSAGSQCNLDRSGSLCRSPLVCYKCLEDAFDIGKGICRNVRASAIISATLAPVAPTARRFNTVGKICRKNADCSRNEMCEISTFIDPPCLTGTCVCRPCYTISAQSSQCELATYYIVGDSCRIEDRNSAFYPPNAECNNGVVLCKPHFSPSLTGGCVRSTLAGYFGAPCKTRTDCDHGLICGYVASKCACPSSNMKWDSIKERCVKREFGDTCSADGDCSVHGNFREGYTYYGGACSATDGRCTCASNYIQTTASFVDVALGQYSKRTICVQHPSVINVDRGGSCQIDPVFSSDSRIYVCAESSICHHCPEDGSLSQSAKSNIGKCRTLIDVPPNAQCFPWLPTTPNRTTTTTPRPVTFRITTTNPPSTTTTTRAPLVAKIVRVGILCNNDSDCGFNEYCQRALVDPGCLKGVCQCKPCHAQEDVSRLCMPMMQLFLGEGCTNSSIEVYPTNAQCKSGLVVCKSCYRQVGNECVKTGRTRLGGNCTSVCDCDGNMFCNQQTFVCECFRAYEKWDAAKGLCIRREFGDTCTNNVECDVFGANYQGYTYSGGQCVTSRCACDPGYTRILTGFVVNPLTGEMGEKAICVLNSSVAVSNRNRGERCNLDPIWFSGEADALSSGICRSRQFCIQCPEDASAGNDGKCRVATPSPASLRCNYQRPLRALPPPTPPANPILMNTVGFPCSRDTECSTNEQCVRTTVDPPCRKGLCQCRSCHAIGVSGMCSQYIQLYLGDYCDGVANEIYPTNATCSLGIVSCKPCFINQGNRCVRATTLRAYGARCLSDCDCDGQGTYCEPDSGTCMCRQYYEKWDSTTQRCLRREFGDPCNNDAQCQTRGQDGAGYTYSGGACVQGRCACSSRFGRTNTSFLLSDSQLVISKSLCVRDGIEVNRTKGQACAVDPIYNSDDIIAGLGSCSANTFCYQCPDDMDLPNFRSTDGVCRTTVSSLGTTRAPPSPVSNEITNPQDCFALYRRNNLTQTIRPQLGPITAPPPPRLAGGSAGVVCAYRGHIFDMLLEHGENKPFASFQLSLMRPCTSISDCRLNEACVVPEAINTGFCACQPPNFYGSDGSCRNVGSMPTASTRAPTTWVRIRIGS